MLGSLRTAALLDNNLDRSGSHGLQFGYAAVVDLPALVKKPADLNLSVGNVDFPSGTGDLERLDLATGAVDWSIKLDSMPFGAATGQRPRVHDAVRR